MSGIESASWMLFKKLHPGYQEFEDLGFVFVCDGLPNYGISVGLPGTTTRINFGGGGETEFLTSLEGRLLLEASKVPLEEIPLYLAYPIGTDDVDHLVREYLAYRLNKA